MTEENISGRKIINANERLIRLVDSLSEKCPVQFCVMDGNYRNPKLTCYYPNDIPFYFFDRDQYEFAEFTHTVNMVGEYCMIKLIDTSVPVSKQADKAV